MLAFPTIPPRSSAFADSPFLGFWSYRKEKLFYDSKVVESALKDSLIGRNGQKASNLTEIIANK